jgi:hypothetical protein
MPLLADAMPAIERFLKETKVASLSLFFLNICLSVLLCVGDRICTASLESMSKSIALSYCRCDGCLIVVGHCSVFSLDVHKLTPRKHFVYTHPQVLIIALPLLSSAANLDVNLATVFLSLSVLYDRIYALRPLSLTRTDCRDYVWLQRLLIDL